MATSQTFTHREVVIEEVLPASGYCRETLAIADSKTLVPGTILKSAGDGTYEPMSGASGEAAVAISLESVVSVAMTTYVSAIVRGPCTVRYDSLVTGGTIANDVASLAEAGILAIEGPDTSIVES